MRYQVERVLQPGDFVKREYPSHKVGGGCGAGGPAPQTGVGECKGGPGMAG